MHWLKPSENSGLSERPQKSSYLYNPFNLQWSQGSKKQKWLAQGHRSTARTRPRSPGSSSKVFHCTRLFHSPLPWATLTWDGCRKPSHSYKVREIGRRLAEERRGHCVKRRKGWLGKGDSSLGKWKNISKCKEAKKKKLLHTKNPYT